jgi:hypothetical protein
VRFKILTSDISWDTLLCIPVAIYLHLRESAAFRFIYKFTLKMDVEVTSAMLVSFYTTTVTDQGSVFESQTGQTEHEKLSWSFNGLNYERRRMGYVAQLHSHTKKAPVWNRATMQF